MSVTDQELADYEQTFEEFWKPILMSGGTLNIDQLKRELHDYRVLMSNVSRVYERVTGGVISKPMTSPDAVIREANRHYKWMWSEDGES
ncbi:hypothetical protein [Alicyclobacillus suci]|uniref:hypothetical protein n=1 Tax=Alicyclobacillus suci TaxID=2816080 RepID=UPI001A8DB81A|nr:hypothetical protein [Alicyclobacillus suci]